MRINKCTLSVDEFEHYCNDFAKKVFTYLVNEFHSLPKEAQLTDIALRGTQIVLANLYQHLLKESDLNQRLADLPEDIKFLIANFNSDAGNKAH